MSGIVYELDDRQVGGALTRLALNADNTAPALNAIGAYGVFSTQRRFELEQGPDGQKWLPLSPRTAAKGSKNNRRGFGHILFQSGHLKNSINYKTETDGVEWGATDYPYASIHQLGGTIDIPARTQTLTLKRTRKKGGGFISRFARATASGNTRTVEATIGAHKVTIPARPYLGVNRTDADEISAIVTDHLADGAGS